MLGGPDSPDWARGELGMRRPKRGSVALIALLAVGGTVLSQRAGIAADTSCDAYDFDPTAAKADDLLANRYQLGVHPIVTLPEDPTWTENPLGDRNWEFVFHSLVWTE